MGRTGDSLHYSFPPRSGGRSPLQEEPLVGRIRPMEWVKMIVAVVVVVLVFVLVVVES